MVPKSLRTWFVLHFAIDLVFGVPLLFVPTTMLTWLGITCGETITARLVGAALMGIGIESFLGRNASREVFDAMLNLKLIWSGSAILGLILSLLAGSAPVTWLFLSVFVIFFIVWARFKREIQ